MIAMMRTLQTLVLILAVLFSTGKTGQAGSVPGIPDPDWSKMFLKTRPWYIWYAMVRDYGDGRGTVSKRWKYIAGRIDDVFTNSSGDVVVVFYASCLGLFRVYCQIPAERADKAKDLKPGMGVELFGYVYNRTSSHVFVVNCHFVVNRQVLGFSEKPEGDGNGS